MSKKLVIFLMAGKRTPDLAEAAIAGGADLIEIGFPFSDPLADGPVIRRAGEQALAEGMTISACLDCLAEIRRRSDVPLVPFIYSALLEARGYERLTGEARAAGANAILVPDLPVDAHPELKRIQLVAPTSTDERIRLAAEATDGWLYLVTLTGTTGARRELSSALGELAARSRLLAPVGLPLYAGFGISTPDQARSAAELTDGVIVGSRAIGVAESGTEALHDYVASLRAAIDASAD